MKLIALIENNDFIVFGSKDLENYKNRLLEDLNKRKKELLDFFEIKDLRKITINFFNDRNDYLNYTRQFFEPVLYSNGNFIGYTINYIYNSETIDEDYDYLLNNVIHELVHIIYQTVRNNNYKRVVWLDEGLAIYLSQQMIYIEQEKDNFKRWYLDRIIRRDKVIPPLSFLKKHGNKYGEFNDQETNKYNGYDLSYLIVKYLIDNNYDIRNLLKNYELIISLEKSVLRDCISYYNDLFEINKIKDNFWKLDNVYELMDYMNKYIIYGWIDIFGKMHIENLKQFRELYRTSSLDEILKTKVASCIEQAILVKVFLDSKVIENKLYCFRRYENSENFDKDVRMHCFVLFFNDNKWYYFEHSIPEKRGIYKFNSIDEALKSIIDSYDEKGDVRLLTEIPDIPENLSLKELNQYVNQFDNQIKKI